jgi:1-phosphatidylinositol-4-phosphate 5-kinase
MPARADRVQKRSEEQIGSNDFEGDLFGESHDVVLYLGMIDILQNYSLAKRIEHAYKACYFDSNGISAVEPKLYAKRFQKFIQKIFPHPTAITTTTTTTTTTTMSLNPQYQLKSYHL